MNRRESQMLDLLKKGRDEFGVVSVKAEFEAEGTRPDEFLRLLELARRADLKVALKIGGCEAVSDMLASKLYGVDYIIGPMIETPYALQKFIEAKEKTYGKDTGGTEFLFNLETQTTLENLDAMMEVAKDGVDGVVFGRVDFTLSRKMDRKAINDPAITEAVLKVATACAAANKELVVGGSVALESLPALSAFHDIRLDRFETRKVIFDGAFAKAANAADGLMNAVRFELAWLENKQDYYGAIAAEDESRIKMIRARLD